jgi:hypothetical protein
LFSNLNQSYLLAIGDSALFTNNSTGNLAIGHKSLWQATQWSNTAIGYGTLRSLTSGFDNVALGCDAGLNQTSGNNNIVIGKGVDLPTLNGSNQIRLGNNQISYAGVQVAWTITSDKRWKEDVRSLPYGLNLVQQLKPVDYIRINNTSKTREAGFIAQDVEEALQKVGYQDQGFLTRDSKGFLELRYNDFIPVLTKAIQEQQLQIQQQNAQIKEQQQRIEKLEKAVNDLLTNSGNK